MDKTRKNNITFSIIAAILIALFCFALTPVTFQNDTFYTIKVGEQIQNNGIDMQEHFSWHENLEYTYPHWLYDLITYKVYNLGGFKGLYIFTGIISAVLGLTLFFTNRSNSKNAFMSFFITITTLFLLRGFIAARAQLVTFILFTLEYYIIERFVAKKKFIHVILLFLIATLIANLHIAVWPFFFILFLPHIGARVWIWLGDKIATDKSLVNAYIKDIEKEKKKDPQSPRIKTLQEGLERETKLREERIKRREEKVNNSYKVEYVRNNNVWLLIPIMMLCAFTGLLSPLGPGVTYTYLFKTVMGDTTQFISEHLPTVVATNPSIVIYLIVFLGILIFTKVKISLSDFFLNFGLLVLALITLRQTSMLILLGSFALTKLCADALLKDKSKYDEIINMLQSHKYLYFYIVLVVFGISTGSITENLYSKFVDYKKYPVDATTYIKDNLDVNNIRLFNEYNFGSYLLLNDIPVFIDSRCDLYTPEYNPGVEVFDDFMHTRSLDIYPEDTFEKYNITHIIIAKDTPLYNVVDSQNGILYNELYSDDYFVVYERVLNSNSIITLDDN